MTALLTADRVSVRFMQSRSLGDMLARRPARALVAVDDVSLSVGEGETLGLVGESGCGKTTLGRALLGLVPRSSGTVTFDGQDIDARMDDDLLAFRRGVQMVFQDPYAALNPKMTVGDALAEVLKVHRICPPSQIRARVDDLLETVGLSPDLANRRPRALSGGQCQRIGVARALAVEPKMIVADEAVSALDVSVQAQILNLLAELQRKRNLAMIFIAHDLSVVRHICKRVAVMYLGRIVEMGSADQVFNAPRHPYTHALLAAKLKMGGPRLQDTELLSGEPPSPLSVPPGCAFNPRCSQVMERCRSGPPPALISDGDASVACHLYSKGAVHAATREKMLQSLSAGVTKAAKPIR